MVSRTLCFCRNWVPSWFKAKVKDSTNFAQERFLSKLAVRLSIYLAVVVAVVAFLVVDTLDDSRRLVSACGVVALILVGVVLSKHPTKIRWRQVRNSSL